MVRPEKSPKFGGQKKSGYYYWQSDITGFEKLTNDMRNENESTETILENLQENILENSNENVLEISNENTAEILQENTPDFSENEAKSDG